MAHRGRHCWGVERGGWSRTRRRPAARVDRDAGPGRRPRLGLHGDERKRGDGEAPRSVPGGSPWRLAFGTRCLVANGVTPPTSRKRRPATPVSASWSPSWTGLQGSVLGKGAAEEPFLGNTLRQDAPCGTSGKAATHDPQRTESLYGSTSLTVITLVCPPAQSNEYDSRTSTSVCFSSVQ